MDLPEETRIVSALPALVPFVGPEAQERAAGRAFRARLGANESVFGPSPKVLEAIAEAACGVWMYGDPENVALKEALAAHHGVAPENIVIGEGIDGLLGYLCRIYVAPSVKVVTSDGAYPTFNFHVAGNGGDLVKVPYRDDAEDPQALLAAGQGARLIYFANPDNPMGSVHGADAVQDMMARVPEGALLVLDEAYVEFGPAPAPIDVRRENVIRLRTFSKAYGMAGARVGYAIAHEGLAERFDKIRNHFGMSRISVAGALAALADQAHLAWVLTEVAGARARIGEIVAAEGLRALPSATNFVTVDCGRDGDFARAVLQGLNRRGVFVRMPFVVPEDRCIRISAGRAADLDVFEEALGPALQEAMSVV